MKNDPKGKKGKILAHLQRGQVITPQTALRLYGHMRLASCIHRLRGEGYNIITTMRTSLHGEPYAEYKLVI